ncbi:MAPK regulated corepressor interacting protein 2-like [Centruroides vittatus]|uniref:MAPK regulated corepressor interacting protein 2-like n=1 Tax=Centruroides vittatus TaxID=120091 RepID=UPI00350FAD1A
MSLSIDLTIQEKWHLLRSHFSVRRSIEFQSLPGKERKLVMYALSKGPYNVLNRTRRGLTQKLDNLENPRDHPGKKSGDFGITADMSSPKPVFQPINDRRSHSHRNHQETITPQHEEITTYIHETGSISFLIDFVFLFSLKAWKLIFREYESTKQTSVDGKVARVVYYQDRNSNQRLKNFEPFDLELYWGERLLQNIKQST